MSGLTWEVSEPTTTDGSNEPEETSPEDAETTLRDVETTDTDSETDPEEAFVVGPHRADAVEDTTRRDIAAEEEDEDSDG